MRVRHQRSEEPCFAPSVISSTHFVVDLEWRLHENSPLPKALATA